MNGDAFNVMFIDLAHPFENIRKRGQTDWLESREKPGFFKKIWSVHPVADVGGGSSNKLELHTFSSDHIVVEGVSRSHPEWPRFLAPLDFLFSQLELVRLLRRIIRDEGVSMVMATDPLYGGLLGRLLKHWCGVPLIVAVTGNFELAYRGSGTLVMPRLFPFYWLQTLATRVSLSGADLVIAYNGDNRNFAVRAGADPARTFRSSVAPFIQHWHYRDLEKRGDLSPVLSRLNIPPAPNYLLMVSRLQPIKFAEDGVRAMKVVVDAAPDTVAIVAGDGPLRPQLEALVRSWRLERNIIFVGNVDQETLSILIPHCITLSPLVTTSPCHSMS